MERAPLLTGRRDHRVTSCIEEGASTAAATSPFNIQRGRKATSRRNGGSDNVDDDDDEDSPDARAYNVAIRGGVFVVFVCVLSVVLVAYAVPYNERFGRRKGPSFVERPAPPVAAAELPSRPLMGSSPPMKAMAPEPEIIERLPMRASAKDNVKVKDDVDVDEKEDHEDTEKDKSRDEDEVDEKEKDDRDGEDHEEKEEEDKDEEGGGGSRPATDPRSPVSPDVPVKPVAPVTPVTPTVPDIVVEPVVEPAVVSVDEPAVDPADADAVSEGKTEFAVDQLSTPNILFVLADDLGYNSLGQEVSPFLYQLRAEGIALPQYYTADVCTPARASLLTGRYALTLGWQYDEHIVSKSGGLGLEETTVAEVLQQNHYTTYLFGKWNLGNLSPRYLPTARGFNYFLGFLNGYTYYWSKLYPYHPNFHDFMYADDKCYYGYDGADMKHYSTNLYKDKAVAAIEAHDYSKSSLFMFISSQAVHDPFADNNGKFPDGVPRTYLNGDTYDYIYATYQGAKVREYYKSLAVLDRSVEAMYNAFKRTGVLDNTYILFASDNGGCPAGGGRNYPLRGTKGSLFEGGVKVEAFIHSAKLPASARGSSYSHLFHVSDWFPTILDMAGVTHTPASGFELDGVSHHATLTATGRAAARPPREHMLINYYYNPAAPTETHMTSVPMAVRNSRYKLLHTYDSMKAGAWYGRDDVTESDDDLLTQGGCAQEVAWKTGQFTKFLFDLENDPTETTNLYNKDADMIAVQDELYAKLDEYTQRAVAAVGDSSEASKICFVKWKENNDYVMPWAPPEDPSALGGRVDTPHPDNCGMFTAASKTKVPGFMSALPRGKGNY